VPLIRDRNLGMMRNLEQTLSKCRGRYVALIEGDDYWTCVDKLQTQVDFLDTHPEYAICCHRARILNEMGGEHILVKAGVTKSAIFPSRQAGTYKIEDLLAENFIMTCTAMYRNRAVRALPRWFLELKLGDWPLCVLAARSGPIFLMNEVMAAYRVHSGGFWSSQTSMGRLRASTQMLEALDGHLDFKYHDIVRRTIAPYYLTAAVLARQGGDRRETARLLLNYVRNGGWQFPENRPQVRTLAGYILLGSWHGMSVKTQLIQFVLNRFGYKLVRVNTASDSPPTPASPLAYGLDTFFSLLKRFNFSPGHIFDVGANRGLWTRKAIQFFPDAQYTLVEPQNNLKVYIQDLLDAKYKITWINAGASDTSGSLPLNISYRDDSSTFILQPADSNLPQITVPVKTLNEIAAASNAPPPDMVKIDAEGLDLEVLAGASDLIGKTEIFFVEVVICSIFYDNTIARVVRRMDDAGYRVIDITDINRSTKYGVLWLCELAFLKKSSHLLDNATSYE
jgi:FkbM family methyltransferase